MKKLTLTDLGYTQKWIDFGLLTEEFLQTQLLDFEKGEDQNSEHYRYAAFLTWLRNKDQLTDQEIENYLELAMEDPDELMAGSAVKELYFSPILTKKQLQLTREKFRMFGDWTLKHIKQVELQARLEIEGLTPELIHTCINHYKEYNSSYLTHLIIDRSDQPEVLELFTTADFGKKIRNLANQKLKRIRKMSK